MLKPIQILESWALKESERAHSRTDLPYLSDLDREEEEKLARRCPDVVEEEEGGGAN
jgi:hypothetical protein